MINASPPVSSGGPIAASASTPSQGEVLSRGTSPPTLKERRRVSRHSVNRTCLILTSSSSTLRVWYEDINSTEFYEKKGMASCLLKYVIKARRCMRKWRGRWRVFPTKVVKCSPPSIHPCAYMYGVNVCGYMYGVYCCVQCVCVMCTCIHTCVSLCVYEMVYALIFWGL